MRFALESGGGKSWIAHSLYPFVHTYHGTEPRLFARTFSNREDAEKFKREHNVNDHFHVVELP